jgi:hypothetical protein
MFHMNSSLCCANWHLLMKELEIIFTWSKSFIYQQMHFISVSENIKICMKTYIKIARTYFGLRPSSGSLYKSLAKVTSIKSVKVRHYGPCGCVAACYIKSMVVCETLHSTQHTHHHGRDITCCHTTAWSIMTYFYRFNKCDFS